MTTLKYFTGEPPLREGESLMPLRSGDYKPIEKLARYWPDGDGGRLGGVGQDDSQPWIPPVKTPIVYPEGKNLQTRIPLDYVPKLETSHSGGELFTVAEYYGTDLNTSACDDDRWPGRRADWDRTDCWPVCHHSCDQCPTKPDYHYITGSPGRNKPPIPDPEGHRLPEGTSIRGSGQVVNVPKFDEKPWLDTAPIDVQAKVGYTNFDNDLEAGDNPRPGECWAEYDQEHRKASHPKPCTEDASQPPRPLRDSLAGLRGRQCKSSLCPMPEDAHAKTLYCSERCRNRSEYIRRSGQVGTVVPDGELASFSVDRKRIGIDTDDLGFTRLLAGVA